MNFSGSRTFLLLAAALFWFSEATRDAFGQTNQVTDLVNQRELFIDDHLIGEMKNVQLLVHSPVREEIAVTCDAAWEGNGCGYYTVLHDKQEAIYRMYYHAWQIPTGIEPGGPLTIAYFESSDGITWQRPNRQTCDSAVRHARGRPLFADLRIERWHSLRTESGACFTGEPRVDPVFGHSMKVNIINDGFPW